MTHYLMLTIGNVSAIFCSHLQSN